MCKCVFQVVALAVCFAGVNPINSSASENADAAFKRDTTYAHYGYGHQGQMHDRSDYNPDRSSYGGGGGGGGGYGGGGQGSPGMSALALLGFLFFLNMISQALMMPTTPAPATGGRRKRSSPFPEDGNELWSLLYDASDVSSTAIQTYARALEAETDSCVLRLLCEMNQRRADNSTDVRRLIGQIASTAISYALHGDDTRKHEANLVAAHLGENGGSCDHLFHQCTTRGR